MKIGFTLCFVEYKNKFLMLFRNKAPNQYRWNGVGGKIEPDELPIFSCQREIMEETGLDIPISSISFRGIVTWNDIGGMYVYVAKSHSDQVLSGDEGNLEWKTLDWILTSGESVSNIPLFLPYMLIENNEIVEHSFQYNDREEIELYQIQPIQSIHVDGKLNHIKR
jgi:8-oxo-dGTP diphosphatase